MEIERYEMPTEGANARERALVSRALVAEAVADAALANPTLVHRTVARSVARGSHRTKQLRLERLARAVMAADERITDPTRVWATDFTALPIEAFETIDAGIRRTWTSVATRNAMRDSVRSVVRESLKAGLLTHDEATPRLAAVTPEKQPRNEEKQSRGHLPARRVEQVFHELALDPSLTARRDTALIALLVGAGLRRGEAVKVDMADLDEYLESVVVTGKGGVVRDVPLAPGVRRALRTWIDLRGREPGPLLAPMSRTVPRRPVLERRMSTDTVAQVVARRVGDDVAPHDLRRTFTGDLLESGADLSTASKVLGHVNPATTAGYDRRGHAARRAAVERLFVPVEDPVAT